MLSIWGYLQYFEIIKSNNNNFPITGPYFNPSILGGMMSILLTIIIVGILPLHSYSYKKIKRILISSFIILTSIPIFILISARAAWFTLSLSILFGVFNTYKLQISLRKKIICSLGIICCLVLLLSFLYHLRPLSVNGRLLIWKVSCQMIKDRPITGFGKGGFESNYMFYQAQYMENEASDSEKYVADNNHIAFNEIVRITVEHGVIGTVAFILFIISILQTRVKQDTIAITAKSVILTIFIWGMFSYPNQVFIIIALMIISSAILLKRNDQLYNSNTRLITIQPKLIRLMIIIICIPSTMILQKQYNLHRYLYNYAQAFNAKSSTDSLSYLLKEMPNNINVLSLYAYKLKKKDEEKKLLSVTQLMINLYPNPSLLIQKGDLLYKMNDPVGAEAAYKQAAQMVPTRQKARYKLALLYYYTGKKSEAIILAKGLLNENVKNYGFETYEIHQNLKKIFCKIL